MGYINTRHSVRLEEALRIEGGVVSGVARPPKRWFPTIRLYGATTQKTTTSFSPP
jgi:hypothetical protein